MGKAPSQTYAVVSKYANATGTSWTVSAQFGPTLNITLSAKFLARKCNLSNVTGN